MQNVFLIVWLVLFFIALVMLLRHLLLWRRAGTTKEEPTPPQAEPVKTAEQSPPAENKTKEDTTTQERPESSKDNFAPAPEEHTLPNSEPKISEQQILNEKLLWAVILGNLELTRQLHEQGGMSILSMSLVFQPQTMRCGTRTVRCWPIYCSMQPYLRQGKTHSTTCSTMRWGKIQQPTSTCCSIVAPTPNRKTKSPC